MIFLSKFAKYFVEGLEEPSELLPTYCVYTLAVLPAEVWRSTLKEIII